MNGFLVFASAQDPKSDITIKEGYLIDQGGLKRVPSD